MTLAADAAVRTWTEPDPVPLRGTFILLAALAGTARERGFDGVVCGHIHHAEMRDLGGVLYLNCGDWVESCTALVEHHDGRIELVDWASAAGLSFLTPRSVAAA